MSEGLDFADINGRAVIITGIPFPPRMEPKVSGLVLHYETNMCPACAIGSPENAVSEGFSKRSQVEGD